MQEAVTAEGAALALASTYDTWDDYHGGHGLESSLRTISLIHGKEHCGKSEHGPLTSLAVKVELRAKHEPKIVEGESTGRNLPHA